ncbi:MAG: hypothetical protein KHX40_07755 [Oscillospiraceae bacterium]|nr:hypothetical protein [Oscillospiraceae bacterium]
MEEVRHKNDRTPRSAAGYGASGRLAFFAGNRRQRREWRYVIFAEWMDFKKQEISL